MGKKERQTIPTQPKALKEKNGCKLPLVQSLSVNADPISLLWGEQPSLDSRPNGYLVQSALRPCLNLDV